MNQWLVKDFSKLTHVTVRTLHHYDRTGLLKPSLRLTNGYRVYSEADLKKLQQILTLKSFGFELLQIKDFLSGEHDILTLLQLQKDFLVKKTTQLSEAVKILTAVIQDCQGIGSVDLVSTLKLIEVNKMVKDLENTSLSKIFTKDQLQRFATVPKCSEEEAVKYGKDWEILIEEVGQHVHDDPYGGTGQAYARKWMDLVECFWGKDRDLGTTIWDCYKNDSFPKDGSCVWPPIPKDVITWIDQAVYFMYSGQKKEGFNMHKEIIAKPAVKLIGISVRTNYENEKNWQSGKIFPCVQQYFQQNIASKIPNRIKPGTTFCVYTDYDEDRAFGPYTYFIGEEVSDSAIVPQDLSSLSIPAQNYIKFTTEPGAMPGVVRNAWGRIWQMPPKQLGGDRAFLADFEIYDERASDPSHQNVVLDLYVGIKT